MSRSLDDLTPHARAAAERVQELCGAAGIDLLIYCTLRRLDEQARLWRQSRARARIDRKCADLRARGLGFLAEVIESVGPCSGPHVTNAAPGESFHQYGTAWDAVPLIGGKPAWREADAPAHWAGYGEACRLAGLQWAGDWTRFRELPHAQLGAGSNPLRVLEPAEVRRRLARWLD